MTANGLVVIDDREITITPIFKFIEVENIPKSETAGHAVMEMKEVVEVRFAGSKNYSPVFRVDEMWKREGNRIITYAERWPEQYRAFKEGNPQEAAGTPLEMLRPYGVTPELVSLCRALRIYSIEALHNLEGTPLKSLGMNQNRLKDAARQFMADKLKGADTFSEIEKLQARIAELEGRSTLPPESEPGPEEVEKLVQEADEEFAGWSDDDLKAKIAELAGSRPRGTPSRATLVASLKELQAAA